MKVPPGFVVLCANADGTTYLANRTTIFPTFASAASGLTAAMKLYSVHSDGPMKRVVKAVVIPASDADPTLLKGDTMKREAA